MDSAHHRLIIALDDMDRHQAFSLIENTRQYAQTFKIGLNLFCQNGPDFVREIKALGVDVFLDLKLHDIPVQVAKAVEVVVRLEPRFLTIHALGGLAMLKEAARAAAGSQTTLLAVSVLTSLNQKDFLDLGFLGSLEQGVSRLVNLAYEAGMRGFVCSPHEASSIKALVKNCTLVCPGIRSKTDDKADQARVMTAREALNFGADFIVVGRPITQAKNPAMKAGLVHQEIHECLYNEAS